MYCFVSFPRSEGAAAAARGPREVRLRRGGDRRPPGALPRDRGLVPLRVHGRGADPRHPERCAGPREKMRGRIPGPNELTIAASGNLYLCLTFAGPSRVLRQSEQICTAAKSKEYAVGKSVYFHEICNLNAL